MTGWLAFVLYVLGWPVALMLREAADQLGHKSDVRRWPDER